MAVEVLLFQLKKKKIKTIPHVRVTQTKPYFVDWPYTKEAGLTTFYKPEIFSLEFFLGLIFVLELF